ncbi:hypothetical protein RKE38_13470 [Phycicoccus sp. M110.8]|uniref:hypothetical protein n=1 Tax=Phycicoccus sp. M110.8 TaxID=3075433 RepID=UPI0028FD28C8|nr:hypothetical protein [Phycicoccus sp. M110.8]MDU0314702.1 hypothetical protein [Phycicoccus sp. M110.8]
MGIVPLGAVVVEDVVEVLLVVEEVAVLEVELDVVELVAEAVVLDDDGDVVLVTWWTCLEDGDTAMATGVEPPPTGRAMAAATPRVGTVSAAMTPSTRPYLGTETVLIEKPHDLPARRRLAARGCLRAAERRHFPPIGPIRPEVSSAR